MTERFSIETEEQRVRQETWRRSVRETCESILMREGQRVN